VKLGVATNGVVYDAFVDSQQPHVLDVEPFMRIDLAQVAAGDIDPQTSNLLEMMRASTYNPEAIAEQAFEINLRDRLKACILDEFRNPSEAFCRHVLEQIGICNARPAVIEQHYRPILKSAMEQAIVIPVLQALRRLPSPAAKGGETNIAAPAEPRHREPIGERLGDELAAFGRSRRRSA
jgi:predicted type IV restriction endonuclease